MNQRETFHSVGAQLKAVRSHDELESVNVPILDADGALLGYLAPLAVEHLGDVSLIDSFVRWRSEHSYAYLSRFPVTAESTLNWARSAVIENPDRIIFLVLDADCRPIGRLGVLDTKQTDFALEVDNVLRGEPGSPGLFRLAIETLEKWATAEFEISEISLEVIESNERAVNFYAKLGYVETHRTAMQWQVTGDFEALKPGTPADEVVLKMVKQLLR